MLQALHHHSPSKYVITMVIAWRYPLILFLSKLLTQLEQNSVHNFVQLVQTVLQHSQQKSVAYIKFLEYFWDKNSQVSPPTSLWAATILSQYLGGMEMVMALLRIHGVLPLIKTLSMWQILVTDWYKSSQPVVNSWVSSMWMAMTKTAPHWMWHWIWTMGWYTAQI